MRPSKESKRRSRPSSPLRDRTAAPSARFERRSSSPPKPRASALLNRDLVVTDVTATTRFEEELATSSSFNNNPRSFPYSVKQQCWDKAEKIKGRDPDRWRRDPLGNTIFRKLVGCPGCLCHDYDHIVPYSKLIEQNDYEVPNFILDGDHRCGERQGGMTSVVELCEFKLACDRIWEDKVRSKIARSYRQQSIDQKEIGLSFLEPSSSRRVLIVGFQVVTWIFSNCQPMAMSVVDKIQGDVESNDNLRCCVTCRRIYPKIEGETGD
ncbi:hypothetical protein DVH24_008880 [Malus domestica]|uniref:HNH domain-containing protein n=1 Tax=Malus domestica TaxID=3750 RepID=A0A498JMV8_MALDO|nr:hypothetical protein DVH24_008880 [Malus domestica]